MDDIRRIAPPFDLLLTASAAELDWIASQGIASDQDRHRDALQTLLQEQRGRLHEDQLWFPYEVIERGAAHCQLGHEREFVLCTLLLFLAVDTLAAVELDLALHFDDHAMTYETLPPVLRDVVLDAYETVRA